MIPSETGPGFSSCGSLGGNFSLNLNVLKFYNEKVLACYFWNEELFSQVESGTHRSLQD